MNHLLEPVRRSQALLKYAIGAVLLIIGLDKIFRTDLVVNWDIYVPALAANVVPAATIILILGVAEVIVALMMLTRWTRLAAYVSAAVLLVTTTNLLLLGYIDIAARDALLLGGALVLAWLTEGLQREGVKA